MKLYINLYDENGRSVGAIELEPRVVDSLPVEGKRRGELVFNISNGRIYYWNGSEWRDLSFGWNDVKESLSKRVSDKGLVLYLPFEEGEGNIVYDESPYGNDGTIYGATWVKGRYGYALSFDGEDDYVKVPDSASLDITDDLTVVAWVKGYGFVVSKGVYGVPSDSKAYDFDVESDGTVRAWLVRVGTNYVVRSTTKIYTTKFNQIAFTFKSPKIRIYINGELDAEMEDPDVYINTNDLDLLIGRSWYGGDPLYFNGIIDEVRIYNRALSDEEIKQLYFATKSRYTSSVIVSDKFRILDSAYNLVMEITKNGIGNDILPKADNTYDLGSTSSRWAKGRFASGIITKADVGDYGGNFANYTPPEGEEGMIIVAIDTNSTNPGKRLYVYANGEWHYVDLT